VPARVLLRLNDRKVHAVNMSAVVLIFTVFMAISVPYQCFAWSQQGHQWIAESAGLALTTKETTYFNGLLKQGVVVPPKYYQASTASRLGIMAVWIDSIRGLTLSRLFKEYGSGAVPKALVNFKLKTSASWHYSNINVLHPKNKLCKAQQSGRLLEVWPLLFQAYEQSIDAKDKTLLLALILHFSADAYQPLHLASSFSKECQSDRGGNAVCIERKSNSKKCKLNLHRLWDRGFGVFDAPYHWQDKLHPTTIFTFDKAISLSAKALPSVYRANAKQYQSSEYLKQSKTLVTPRVGYAVGHSVLSLKYLYSVQ